MKSIVVFVALVFAIVHASDSELFRKFMVDYNRVYSSNEEFSLRFTNFKNNIRRIDQLNNMPGQLATFGINKFADFSAEEFAAKLLLPKFDANDLCIWPFHETVPQEKVEAAPTNFDWRAKGAVTPVKNQGDCGSCWTFSTTGNIEGQWQIWSSKHNLVGLSEQWIVDCSTSCLQSEPDLCNSGCDGGLPWLAYGDIINNKGLTTESSYPYTGEDGTCTTGNPISAVIANWTAVSTVPTQIQAYMYSQGPLSITMNAGLLMSYMSGIITGSASDCPVSEMDHAILMVGYGHNSSANVDYWTVKNSWGTDWGMNGYFQIQSDQGLCGINACVTSALLS